MAQDKDSAMCWLGPLPVPQFMQACAPRLLENAMVVDEALASSFDLLRCLVQDATGSYFQAWADMIATGSSSAASFKVAHPDHLRGQAVAAPRFE